MKDQNKRPGLCHIISGRQVNCVFSILIAVTPATSFWAPLDTLEVLQQYITFPTSSLGKSAQTRYNLLEKLQTIEEENFIYGYKNVVACICYIDPALGLGHVAL